MENGWAARDMALNPVRAKLVARAQDWPWSSAPGTGGSLSSAFSGPHRRPGPSPPKCHLRDFEERSNDPAAA